MLSRSVVNGWVTDADLLITASTARVSSREYGSAARIRCCAFTIRDDAMSSCARVILEMDLTEAIRRLTARSCAAIFPSGLRRRLGWHPAGDGLTVLVLQRLGRLVLDQQVAVALLEGAAEAVHRVLEPAHRVIGQGLGLPDGGQDAGVVALEVVEELGLEPADVLD